jgi:hypothetical protein
MQHDTFIESLGGSWWCLHCHAPAPIEDPGESNPVCGSCGKRKCEWRSFHDVTPAESPLSLHLSPPALEIVPHDAEPMCNKKRLPRTERPSLSVMTFQGYWRCLACEEPTKRDAQECCVLCGSSLVEFQQPTLTE